MNWLHTASAWGQAAGQWSSSESVCADCHVQGATQIEKPGRIERRCSCSRRVAVARRQIQFDLRAGTDQGAALQAWRFAAGLNAGPIEFFWLAASARRRSSRRSTGSSARRHQEASSWRLRALVAVRQNGRQKPVKAPTRYDCGWRQQPDSVPAPAAEPASLARLADPEQPGQRQATALPPLAAMRKWAAPARHAANKPPNCSSASASVVVRRPVHAAAAATVRAACGGQGFQVQQRIAECARQAGGFASVPARAGSVSCHRVWNEWCRAHGHPPVQAHQIQRHIKRSAAPRRVARDRRAGSADRHNPAENGPGYRY